MTLFGPASAEYILAIDKELRRITDSRDLQYAEFFNMLHYHLGWTDRLGMPENADAGKRLRPLLCLWTCEAAGGEWQDALPAAAAIELIHNFSLIHDDIEDDSSERRGRPTVWKVWGLAEGINSGDAMYAMAHIALDGLCTELSLETHLEIRRAFDNATFALTKGQFLDLHYEDAADVSLERYWEMVRGKTAALVRGSCEIGTRVATKDQTVVNAFSEYGENLGIGFQIADDILGIWGDPEVTGKSARTDIVSRKKSYPIIYAMQEDSDGELRTLYRKKTLSDQDIEQVERILARTNAREQSAVQASHFAELALTSLRKTGIESPAIERLGQVVEFAVSRDK